MNSYIVRIESDVGVSTGFLYSPSNSDLTYIICSLHGIVHQEDLRTSNRIEIQFFDGANSRYRVTDTDHIVKGRSIETEDIAAIAIEKNKLQVIVNRAKLPSLLQLTGREKWCEVKGLPTLTDNKFIRTLRQTLILSDKNFPFQVQIEVSDPVTEHVEAPELIEGYSGSPLIIQQAGEVYCFGIFTDYEDVSRRVLGITFEGFNSLLKLHGYPPFELHQIETDEGILTDINRVRNNTERVFGRVRKSIGGIHLSRAEVVDNIKKCLASKPVTVISGIAGAGKSAMTKIALESLDAHYDIIALQGEQLDKTSIDEIFAEPSLGIRDFKKVLDSPGLKRTKVLLLDSIEKVMETLHAETVVDFFNLLSGRSDLRIVLTCRTYASFYLQIRFLREFPSVAFYEIPPLSDKEIDNIINEYPSLRAFVSNPSIKDILRIPFNLDKATLLEHEKIGVLDTELAFKNLVWKYVVENCDKEPDRQIQALRGLVLEELAVARARMMTPFVNLSPDKIPILQRLAGDSIVDKSTDSTKGYSISHDIFEDWALLRFIDRTFYANGNLDDCKQFFQTISYSPGIRRAYRMWLEEKLTVRDKSIVDFLSHLLVAERLESYWKDETLLAILQTKHLKGFVSEFRTLLFQSNNALFKRCILLLNVACQRPNFKLLELLNKEERRSAYSNAYLVPYGEAWATLLQFIGSEIENLRDEFATILPLIEQWGKKLRLDKNLPKEAIHVGKIILIYFDQYKKDLITENHYGSSKHFQEMVSILFQLSEIYFAQIAVIIQEATAFKRNRENYRMDNFHSEILEQALSWINSQELCKYLPNLVIEAARREWLYIPPSPEEQAAIDQDTPIYARPTMEHEEKTFGITSENKRDYSPPGALQTPIYNLLRSQTMLTTKFIVELFNHSVDAFWQSDFLLDNSFIGPDPRAEVKYILAGGKEVHQYGSSALWSMYRGGRIATPYLLQSVLRALEKYLLELAECVNDDKANKYPRVKPHLFNVIDLLISNSKSVSTTAVVVSVGTAYPILMAEKLLPLLRVKEFYKWDAHRWAFESRVLNPWGPKPIARLVQEDNARSNNLPHRKQHLRSVMLNLGFSEFKDHVIATLEFFEKENDRDQDWRFTLANIDFRKLQVVKEVENGLMVEAKLDPDLEEVVKQQQLKQDDLSTLQIASNWALQKLKDNHTCTEDEYDLWQRHFRTAFDNRVKHEHADLFNHPALLAFIGLRDFFPRLSDDEKSKSFDRIFRIIRRDLERTKDPYDLDMESPFTAFERDSAYPALIEIILKTTGKVQAEAKSLCFWSIILLNKGQEKDKLTDGVAKGIPDFARLCVFATAIYGKSFPTRMRLQRFYQFENFQPTRQRFKGLHLLKIFLTQGLQPYKNHKEAFRLEKDYSAAINELVTGLEKENLTLHLDENLAKASPHYLVQAVSLIPLSTNRDDLRQFTRWLLTFLLKNLDRKEGWHEDKIHYELRHQFQKFFGAFLLAQPTDVSLSFFEVLIDECFNRTKYSREHHDFVEHCLEEIISACTLKNVLNFWAMWDRLSDRISIGPKKYFISMLLLDYQYWLPSQRDWPPIRGRKSFFENVIMSEKSLVKETSKLLSGIGFKELLPGGVIWLWKQVEEHGLIDKDEIHYTEKLVVEIFYDQNYRQIVQQNAVLRDAYINLLDRLMDLNSPSAYLIREDVVSFRDST